MGDTGQKIRVGRSVVFFFLFISSLFGVRGAQFSMECRLGHIGGQIEALKTDFEAANRGPQIVTTKLGESKGKTSIRKLEKLKFLFCPLL